MEKILSMILAAMMIASPVMAGGVISSKDNP